jgi:GT2 family glycosyltransferase
MLGIIILNYNSAKDTIDCIKTITESTNINYQIYIVDSCSTDNSYSFLLKYFDDRVDIQLFKTDENRGYSYGNNYGIEKAINDRADVILIVNPDIIFKNEAIDLMYLALLKDEKLAVVGPRVIDKSGTDMQFASRLYTLSSFIGSKKPLAYFNFKRIQSLRYYQYNPEKDFSFCGMVSGCCFMIKASDFRLISFFDSGVFLFYEEDIIAYKLFKINKLTKILSNAVVVHNHSTTINKEGSAFIRYHRFYSSQYVLKKYAHINKIQYVFVSLFHVIPFTINAIFFKSYRKLYPAFLKKVTSLYLTPE